MNDVEQVTLEDRLYATLVPLLTIRDVIVYAGTSDSTIRRAVRAGKLRGMKMPGGWRFRLVDVDNWIDGFLIEPEPVRLPRTKLSDKLTLAG